MANASLGVSNPQERRQHHLASHFRRESPLLHLRQLWAQRRRVRMRQWRSHVSQTTVPTGGQLLVSVPHDLRFVVEVVVRTIRRIAREETSESVPGA